MKKDLTIAALFELYKSLLTEKQREIFSSYYYFDLSLGEIAEITGSTRQSAYEALKTVKDKLLEYEALLSLNKKFSLVEEAVEGCSKEVKDKIKAILGE